MRVVFMGTPDIAATCLEQILADGFEVVGVYTQPDRPKGRGMKLVASPVKELALKAGIPVFQPEHFREETTAEELRQLAPDVCAVVAYGRILPQRILDIPALGCVNIHASLLPQYRGSAPYQWAVLDGREETGVTAQHMALQMDAGDIIDVAKTPIGENETAGELLDRLAVLGADLLSRVLTSFEKGTVTRTPQDESQVSFAPMLDKSMCPIDWTKPAQKIHDQVRGLHPWPVAIAEIGGTKFKIHQTVLVEGKTNKAPGTPVELNKTGLRVACGDGSLLEIRQLQAEGGKRMAAPDYFRGHPLEI
jgi:methionyl-tRNA formyltransferase